VSLVSWVSVLSLSFIFFLLSSWYSRVLIINLILTLWSQTNFKNRNTWKHGCGYVWDGVSLCCWGWPQTPELRQSSLSLLRLRLHTHATVCFWKFFDSLDLFRIYIQSPIVFFHPYLLKNKTQEDKQYKLLKQCHDSNNPSNLRGGFTCRLTWCFEELISELTFLLLQFEVNFECLLVITKIYNILSLSDNNF
jgi:hypothetical protein